MKHHGAIDKHSMEQQLCKSNLITLLCRNSGAIHLVQPGLTGDWQANEKCSNFKICYRSKFLMLHLTKVIALLQ